MKRATAYANANIALVKYWGKNDSRFNIPAVSSLSMTLDDLGTLVTVADSSATEHSLVVDGQKASHDAITHVNIFLDLVREFYPFTGHLSISSKSNVPIAAGLASSASFFAALATALNDYFALDLGQKELSQLARMGSGSAARSIFSGFAGLHGGNDIEHHQAYAFSVDIHQKLKLAMVIVLVSQQKKALSSRSAMGLTRISSPFFPTMVATQGKDFADAMDALKTGSFEILGAVMEHSTLKMFATMWTAKPAINYWHPDTIAIMSLVYRLRDEFGPRAFFTMDAGPNVKILCQQDFVPTVLAKLQKADSAIKIVTQKPGLGAMVMASHLI
ncbi:MAG TPA: diphosphomevalonate decarboxylase [Myxococcota bacterium]|nr:diphosphomevalonate decarboxylase [Myxococcota bacterium]